MSIPNDVFMLRHGIKQLDIFISDCLNILYTDIDSENKRDLIESKHRKSFPQVKENVLPALLLLNSNINFLINMYCSGSITEPVLMSRLEEHSRELKDTLELFI